MKKTITGKLVSQKLTWLNPEMASFLEGRELKLHLETAHFDLESLQLTVGTSEIGEPENTALVFFPLECLKVPENVLRHIYREVSENVLKQINRFKPLGRGILSVPKATEKISNHRLRMLAEEKVVLYLGLANMREQSKETMVVVNSDDGSPSDNFTPIRVPLAWVKTDDYTQRLATIIANLKAKKPYHFADLGAKFMKRGVIFACATNM